MSVEVTCPSGLRFTARRFKVKELGELARAAEANANDGGLANILSACWEDVVEPGPAYPNLASGIRLDWSRVLDGDVTDSLRQIRIATLGPVYPFHARCKHCGRQQPAPLDVSLSDWEVKPYPEETIRAYVSGQPLSTTLPGGDVVRYAPAVLAQHVKLTGAKKRWAKVLEKTYGLKDPRGRVAKKPEWEFVVRHVTHVSSLGERSKDTNAVIEWAENLDLGDLYALQEAVEASEGGVETGVHFRCAFDNCDWDQVQQVPFAGAFFRPEKARKATTETETEEAES